MGNGHKEAVQGLPRGALRPPLCCQQCPQPISRRCMPAEGACYTAYVHCTDHVHCMAFPASSVLPIRYFWTRGSSFVTNSGFSCHLSNQFLNVCKLLALIVSQGKQCHWLSASNSRERKLILPHPSWSVNLLPIPASGLLFPCYRRQGVWNFSLGNVLYFS